MDASGQCVQQTCREPYTVRDTQKTHNQPPYDPDSRFISATFPAPLGHSLIAPMVNVSVKAPPTSRLLEYVAYPRATHILLNATQTLRTS